MQQKSGFVLWVIICLAILIGWVWVQSQFAPPPGKDKDDKKVAEQKDKGKQKEKEKEKVKEEPPRRFMAWESLPALARQAATYTGAVSAPLNLALAGSAANVFVAHASLYGNFVRVVGIKDFKDPVKPVAQEFELGGDGYFLHAVVTTQGGAIRLVAFTPITGFKAADALG